jgi:hypothetical protein
MPALKAALPGETAADACRIAGSEDNLARAVGRRMRRRNACPGNQIIRSLNQQKNVRIGLDRELEVPSAYRPKGPATIVGGRCE